MKLTETDRQLLQDLASGKTQREVAWPTSDASVAQRLKRLREKNGCNTTTQLVLKAFREKQIA